MRDTLTRRAIPAAFIVLGAATLLPFVSASMALVGGITFTLALGNPFKERCSKLTPKMLAAAIVGLGAGMNLQRVGAVGLSGLGYTALGITATLGLGALFSRILRTERDPSMLIAAGTAICGGSAIAAISVAIRAKPSDVTVAMVTVFLLNALAIIIFPPIGHYFGLSQEQFGLWSALAIHDTSSVVGAAMAFGPRALEIGTTVKLARALWIIPVSLAVGAFWPRPNEGAAEAKGKAKRPWFILGFILAAAVVTWVPQLQTAGEFAADAARRLLVVTLFLIGASMTKDRLRQVGFKPFLLGVVLWLVMGSATLAAIRGGLIEL